MPLVIIPRDEVREGEPFWAAMTEAKARKIVAGGRKPRPCQPPRPGERKWGRFAVVDRDEPTARTIEIASAAASSDAPDAVTAASLGVSRARVAQARGETGTPANRPAHRPRSTTYTARTAAGREALAVLVGICEAAGVSVEDGLAWMRANLPRRTP